MCQGQMPERQISMCRDVGYNLIIDTNDFYVGDVFIQLKPYDMYFDMKKVKGYYKNNG